MSKKAKEKKVSYLVGVNLDGPVYCEHKVHEEVDEEKKEHPNRSKNGFGHAQKTAPRPTPNLRQMPPFSKHFEKKGGEDSNSKSKKKG